MPLDLVILGAPGAGKGTQAKKIVAETGVAHIGTGDILRSAIAEQTPLGEEVQGVYDRGALVSDELMTHLMRARLALEDAAAGAVLDGFPRTCAQAERLDAVLAELDRRLAVAIDVHIRDEVAIERMLARASAEGRRDDVPEIMRRRLDVYHRETEPLIGYYRGRGILEVVDGDRPQEEVFADIRRALPYGNGRPS